MNLKYSQKLLFSIILITSFQAFPQNVSDDKNVLSPPIEGLVAVHHPDLKDLEKDVREQIMEFQNSLAESSKSSSKDKKKLSESYGTIGEIYHAYSFHQTAKECYQNASRLMPDNFKWHYLLGKISQEQNKFYDAIDFYKKSFNLNPKYIATLVNLGNVYLELDLLDIAKENFDNALKISPNDPTAIYGLGQIEYTKRNFESAVNYFEKVLNILPDANRVHYSLAISYRGLKNIEKAKFHLAKQGSVGVRVSDPIFESLNDLKKGIRLRILRGKLAFEAERFQDAQIEFEKVLESQPKNITALVNLGTTFVKLGKGTEAIKQFEKALLVHPQNENAHYNLAVLYSLKRNHFQAISHLKQVIQSNPKDVEARFFLAKELGKANLLQEALSEIRPIYNSNPDNETVMLATVQILTKAGNYKQAKEILEKNLSKFPNRGNTMATLAFLLTNAPQNDLRDGNKALELANKVFTASKAIEHGAIVAMAFAELGKCEEAAKLTQQLLEKSIQAKNQNLVLKLQNELKRYQTEKPCNIKI